jgi:hypothetical protein
MVACTFYDCNSTAVADSKTFAYPTTDVGLTTCGTIQQCIAGNNVT